MGKILLPDSVTDIASKNKKTSKFPKGDFGEVYIPKNKTLLIKIPL